MITLTTRLLASLLLVFSVFVRAAEPAEPEDVPLFTQAELDQMLAPVALYPDELLSQVLMAATYPLEVVEATRFARAHPELKGQDAVRAAKDRPWDPSVKAMLAFPQILDRMDQDLDWTRRLGDAFLAQQEQVMDTVQALRKRADEAGNLKETEHVRVVREERTIIVRNRYPDVVYVPYYDPTLIYGSWWWPDYQPVRWSPWTGYRYYSGYSGFFWGPSIVVGHGFFFSHYDWRDRYVRIVEVPPFYYRHPPPPRYRWEHEYRHRKGVPYRHQRVYDRYRDEHDPVPGRPPRDRHDDGGRGRQGDGQPPNGPRQGDGGPRGDGQGPRGDGQGPRGDGQPPRDVQQDGHGQNGPGAVTPDPGEGGQGPQAPGAGETPRTPPPGSMPRGDVPERDAPEPSQPPPVMGTDSRVPGARQEVETERRGDREGRAGREDGAERRREAPVYTAPRNDAPTPVTPREESPRYTPPPREDTPRYTPPSREETPRYTPPPRQETPRYTPPPREETPRYTPPPREETPRYTPPPREERPSYSPPPREERPSYTPPARQESPRYEAPRRETPSYSAPRQERPSYSPPPREERPSYTPPPRQERPSYTPPPRSEPAPERSDDGRERRNRERPEQRS